MTSALIHRKEGRRLRRPIATGATVDYGMLAAIDATGAVVPAGDAALIIVGIVAGIVDGDDDRYADIERGEAYGFVSAVGPGAVTAAHIGAPAFAADATTITHIATDNPPCGVIHDVDGDFVWIRI